MGNCCGIKPHKKETQTTDVCVTSCINRVYLVNDEEMNILRLMYKDLAERISQKKINMENFLVFFHKNGFWGQRLFKQFDSDDSDLIDQLQFVRGIAKILKSTQKKKISLLFKFFSHPDSQGVIFKEFLTMLYNYPKQDLKEILNDKDFIESDLKKHLIPIEKNKGTDRFESQSKIVPPSLANKELNLKKKKTFRLDDQTKQQSSMIGKEILKNIKEKYKPKETGFIIKDGEDEIIIKTMNIQQIVKRFASKIFQEAKISEKNGKLNYAQFECFIKKHKALYENYFNGFHNQVWQLDELTRKIKFQSPEQHDIQSDARMLLAQQLKKVYIILVHTILVICQDVNHSKVILTCCLEGLAVKRIFENQNGFGVQITHREGFYKPKKFFFKNEDVLADWMEHLKYYKGATVQQLYDIGEKIGTGKFSVVYRCKHNIQNNLYAIKVIENFKLQPEARQLIAHESSIMKIVSHPLLLEFKESIMTKTHIYIITELVNGKDLYQLVKQYKFLEEYDAATIIQQLIVGLRFLHSFEIIHRDLKPENIMVVIDEETYQISNIKIIDFGFSNYLSKLKEKSSEELLAGTPNYIAPEVLKEDSISFKIDNFAVGVILFFLLTGSLPFNDHTIPDILANTMNGEYSYEGKRKISDSAKDLIDKFLANDPDDRITLDEALNHPWFKVTKEKYQKQKDRKERVKELKQFHEKAM